MLKHIFIIIMLIFCFMLWEQRPVRYDPGILVESGPTIEKIHRPQPIETTSYIITPKYHIKGKVRVIARKSYWFDEMRNLAPVDLLLAWDRMTDEELLSKMLVKIDDRSYHVQMAKPPFMRGNIHEHLIMAHSIPSTEKIDEKLKSIRRGQLISFSGYIVDIEDRIGSEWTSPMLDDRPNQRSSHWIWFEELIIEELPEDITPEQISGL